MLLIVCPNPALDCLPVWQAPQANNSFFHKGADAPLDPPFFQGDGQQAALTPQVYQQQAGGKGINVGRLLRKLDTRFQIVTQIGGFNGYQLRKQLKGEGLPTRTIMGHTNTRLMVYTQSNTNAPQEILFSGQDHPHPFTQALRPYFKKASAVLFCGSLPSGFPKTLYADLARLAHQDNPNCALYMDCRGDIIRETLACPDVLISGIKINRHEWETWHAQAFDMSAFLIQAQKDYASRGLTHVVVTDKDKPIYGAKFGKGYSATPLVHPGIGKNMGCGDAFMAGWVWALAHQNQSPQEAIKSGVIASAAYRYQTPLSPRILREKWAEVAVTDLA